MTAIHTAEHEVLAEFSLAFVETTLELREQDLVHYEQSMGSVEVPCALRRECMWYIDAPNRPNKGITLLLYVILSIAGQNHGNRNEAG